MEEISSEQALTTALKRGGRTVALFLAHWCPTCRFFQPKFEQSAGAQKNWKPLLVAIDDENNPLWDSYGIRSVPTVILFENGKEVRRIEEHELIDGALERALGQ